MLILIRKKIEILSIVNGIRYQKLIKNYFKYVVTQLGRMQFEISDVLSKDTVFVQEPSLLLPHLRRWKCFLSLYKSARLLTIIVLCEATAPQPKRRLIKITVTATSDLSNIVIYLHFSL